MTHSSDPDLPNQPGNPTDNQQSRFEDEWNWLAYELEEIKICGDRDPVLREQADLLTSAAGEALPPDLKWSYLPALIAEISDALGELTFAIKFDDEVGCEPDQTLSYWQNTFGHALNDLGNSAARVLEDPALSIVTTALSSSRSILEISHFKPETSERFQAAVLSLATRHEDIVDPVTLYCTSIAVAEHSDENPDIQDKALALAKHGLARYGVEGGAVMDLIEASLLPAGRSGVESTKVRTFLTEQKKDFSPLARLCRFCRIKEAKPGSVAAGIEALRAGNARNTEQPNQREP